MNRNAEHLGAGLRRGAGADTAYRSSRRTLLLAVAAWPMLAWTEAVFAQPKQSPVLIGWFEVGSRNTSEHRLTAFKEAFAALGWKEGIDYHLEERWADGRVERLQALAEELAAKRP